MQQIRNSQSQFGRIDCHKNHTDITVEWVKILHTYKYQEQFQVVYANETQ